METSNRRELPRERPLLFDMARCHFVVWGSEKKKALTENATPMNEQNYVNPDKNCPSFGVV